jgi:GxxExxY protein
MDDNVLSSEIIGAAIAVHKELGPGLLESVYESALAVELGDRRIPLARQVDIQVRYKGKPLPGHLRLDLLVAQRVVVEVKAVERVHELHEAQLLSYLRLASLRVGLLINFNVPRLREGVRRMSNGF